MIDMNDRYLNPSYNPTVSLSLREPNYAIGSKDALDYSRIRFQYRLNVGELIKPVVGKDNSPGYNEHRRQEFDNIRAIANTYGEPSFLYNQESMNMYHVFNPKGIWYMHSGILFTSETGILAEIRIMY